MFGKNLMPSLLEQRRFCSTLCYNNYRRKHVKKDYLDIRERKRLMAFAIHHEDQERYLASTLNSTKAPMTEKVVILGELLLQVRATQREVIERYKRLPKDIRKQVREMIAKNPGIVSKQRGAIFCSDCGSTQVNRMGALCPRCRSRKMSQPSGQPVDIIESSDYRRHKDEGAV